MLSHTFLHKKTPPSHKGKSDWALAALTALGGVFLVLPAPTLYWISHPKEPRFRRDFGRKSQPNGNEMDG